MDRSKVLVTSTAPAERILSIDVLRGFAVLGILVMNIQSFSMISAAYINPAAYGDLTGINKWVWILSHLLASEKFMSIFSMLFGAGIIIFTSRIIEKGRNAGPMHYRRNFWLLLFGLAHAYLIWYGDILTQYALCAFLAYLFRNLKPRTLVVVAIAFFIVPLALYLFMGSTIQYWPQESYNQNMQSWLPAIESIQRELEHMRGNWMEQMKYRIPGAIFMQTFFFFIFSFWRVMSMMLLGMALYKWGVLSAERSKAFYLRLMMTGLLAGYATVALGIWKNFGAEWKMEYSMFTGSQFNYIGSVLVSLGYIGFIMLICKTDMLNGPKRVLGSVGRMAFTNYILMSIMATFIFYGHGLGLYGQVERGVQILIVFGIWAVLLIISPLWLKYFYYGPLEWLWRTLTYWRRQRFRRTLASQPSL